MIRKMTMIPVTDKTPIYPLVLRTTELSMTTQMMKLTLLPRFNIVLMQQLSPAKL
jgi:hypothetical protein